MNLLLDFLRERRNLIWGSQALGLLTLGLGLKIAAWTSAGPDWAGTARLLSFLAAGLALSELFFLIFDFKGRRLKALAPEAYPLRGLEAGKRDFIQSSLLLSPTRGLARICIGWAVAMFGPAMAAHGMEYIGSALLLALSLALPLSLFTFNLLARDSLRRITPFFHFEGSPAEGLAAFQPPLRQRFFGLSVGPLAPLALYCALSLALEGQVALGLAAYALVLSAVLAYASSRALETLSVQPLRELEAGLHAFERGDFELALDTVSGDEAGQAISSYEAARKSLSGRVLHLRRFGSLAASLDEVRAKTLNLDGELRSVAVLAARFEASYHEGRLAPAERLRLAGRFCASAAAEAEAQGGALMDFGYGFAVAVFGAPSSHPDPAAAALLAAWRLSERLKVFGNQQKMHLGVNLQWGLAVKAGEEAFGLMGPKGRECYGMAGPLADYALDAARDGAWVEESLAQKLGESAGFGYGESRGAFLRLMEGPAGPQPDGAAENLGFTPGSRL